MFFRRKAQPESSMEDISSAEERKDNILYEKENRVSQSVMLNRYSTTSKDQEESSHEDDKKEKTYSSVELDEMPKRYYEYFSRSELESSSTGGSGVEQEESEYEDTEGEDAEGEDTEGEDAQSVFTHSNISGITSNNQCKSKILTLQHTLNLFFPKRFGLQSLRPSKPTLERSQRLCQCLVP
ncbi:unnamed protein product [Moneuplotes crassus]|uniref:Uncharacterized protein n=1 Tax=Euplotes crassus TaxID=5936 RepID=A0AAD1Y6I9_EUPCR|nr:unnamed protein product [Moneuplotes crassus]